MSKTVPESNLKPDRQTELSLSFCIVLMDYFLLELQVTLYKLRTIKLLIFCSANLYEFDL